MGVGGGTRYTERESPSLKVWMPGHPRHSVRGGCEKSFHENHECQGTHDVRTVSFLTMYGEGLIYNDLTLFVRPDVWVTHVWA